MDGVSGPPPPAPHLLPGAAHQRRLIYDHVKREASLVERTTRRRSWQPATSPEISIVEELLHLAATTNGSNTRLQASSRTGEIEPVGGPHQPRLKSRKESRTHRVSEGSSVRSRHDTETRIPIFMFVVWMARRVPGLRMIGVRMITGSLPVLWRIL